MSSVAKLTTGLVAGVLVSLSGLAHARTPRWDATAEEYVAERLPSDIKIINAPVEGWLFANSRGLTLYSWPGNGVNGDAQGKPSICDDTHYTKTTEPLVPYPAGLELPDSAKRPTCAKLWPPVVPAHDAKPVGAWSIIMRKDGTKQWAYKDFPVYTSVLDKTPGETWGARKVGAGGGFGAPGRRIVGPALVVPALFEIRLVAQGHLLALRSGPSVYVSEGDGPEKSNCVGACAVDWQPVLAPETIVPTRDWTIFQRSPGVYQWAFRKWPLYTHASDRDHFTLAGSDIPGWHNVFSQVEPPAPAGFKKEETIGGIVLADASGRTIYTYRCTDPAPDHESCDTTDAPQVYRLAECGKFDPARCMQNFPYVLAPAGAKASTVAWSVMLIDPATGGIAPKSQPNTLKVWAYRGRPVYLCERDKKPGDIECDSWGDASNGGRNWFKAFWLRDDYLRNAG